MDKLIELANIIFPEINETIEDLERKFPKRSLPNGAEVTRFAPSPTGFLHTGSLCAALRCYKVAQDTNGVFILRIEDTDQAREIVGTDDLVSRELSNFDVNPTEGFIDHDHEKGYYGPYKQSKRAYIYKVVIKDMIKKDLAYPCFCSEEELDEVRKIQNAKKERTGYYGEYAKCRNLTPEQAIQKIKNGEKYVIRFKSHGSHEVTHPFHDEIKGDIHYTENDMDIIIFKSDGLPTYHFGHLCDDHFMHTTMAIRGEEWLPSLPIHLEMYDAVNFPRVKYAHIPTIMKIDENGSKRKLSKRKDPEAAVSYFLERGYPKEALLDYLYTIADSSFEAWFLANPKVSTKEFKINISNCATDGALFDLEKIKNISQTLLAFQSGEQLMEDALKWSKDYDKKLEELILRDKNYFARIMSIEKDKPNPRKDYVTYGEIFEKVKFFYEDYYKEIFDNGLEFDPLFDKNLIKTVIDDFISCSNPSLSEEEWFNACKVSAQKLGFAGNKKEMKAEPDKYKYMIAQYMEIIRVAITGRKNAPNLYYCLNIISKDEINKRLEMVKNSL